MEKSSPKGKVMSDTNTPTNDGLRPLPGEAARMEPLGPYTPPAVRPLPFVGQPHQAPGTEFHPDPNKRRGLGLAQRTGIAALLLLGGWLIKAHVGPAGTPTAAAATAAMPATMASDADIEIKGKSERDTELLHYTFSGHVTNTSLLNAPSVELDAVYHYSLHDANGLFRDGPTVSIPLDTFRNLRPGETRDFSGATAFQKTVPGYGDHPCFIGTNGSHLDCADTMMPVPYQVTIAAHVTAAP